MTRYGRIRFNTKEAYEMWTSQWPIHRREDFPEKFKAFADCNWHNAIFSTAAGICVWEIFEDNTDVVIDTPSVALVNEEMCFIQYELGDQHKPDHHEPSVAETDDNKIDDIIKRIDELQNELLAFIQGKQLCYEQFQRINKALGKD